MATVFSDLMAVATLKLTGLVAAALVLGVGTLRAQQQSQESLTMFERPTASQAAAADTGDQGLAAIQLSGISTLGGQSMFNFVDTRNNRSFWVPLKGTTHGFTVVSYDADTDTVVVEHSGRSRTVPLRQAKIVSMPTPTTPAAVAQAPVRIAPPPGPVIHTPDGGEIVNPKTPQEIAQAETEARMMVSDLLEISMQERARQKALREAQLKQQQQGSQPPAAQGNARSGQ